MVYSSPYMGLLQSYKGPWPFTPPDSPQQGCKALPATDLKPPVQPTDLDAACKVSPLACEGSSPVYEPIQPPRRCRADSPPQLKSPTRDCLALTSIPTVNTSGLPTPPLTPPDSPPKVSRKSPPSSPKTSPTTCHIQFNDLNSEQTDTDSVQLVEIKSPAAVTTQSKPGTTWGGLYRSKPKLRVLEDSDVRGRRSYNIAVIEAAEYFNVEIYRLGNTNEVLLQHHRTLLHEGLRRFRGYKSAARRKSESEAKAATERSGGRTTSPTDKDTKQATNRTIQQSIPIDISKIEQSKLRFYRSRYRYNFRQAIPVISDPGSINANVNEPPAVYPQTKHVAKPSKLRQTFGPRDLPLFVASPSKTAKEASLRKLEAEIDGNVNYGLGLYYSRSSK